MRARTVSIAVLRVGAIVGLMVLAFASILGLFAGCANDRSGCEFIELEGGRRMVYTPLGSENGYFGRDGLCFTYCYDTGDSEWAELMVVYVDDGDIIDGGGARYRGPN